MSNAHAQGRHQESKRARDSLRGRGNSCAVWIQRRDDGAHRGPCQSTQGDYRKSPKANLHRYFPTKELLYKRVLEDICGVWMDAALAFDGCDAALRHLYK
jgi:hypothetical protein